MFSQKGFIKLAQHKPSWKVKIDYSELTLGRGAYYILTFVDHESFQVRVKYTKYKEFMKKIKGGGDEKQRI